MPENPDLRAVPFHSAIHAVEVYGLILLALDGRIVSWNHGARQLLGFDESAVIDQHFEVLFTREDRERNLPRTEIANALRLGYGYDDRWLVRQDQSRVYVNGGLCLLKTGAGDPLGFVKIIRDQTERKEHLEKIEQLSATLLQNKVTLEAYASTLELKVQERTRLLNERNAELQDFCHSIAHDLRAPLRSISAMSKIVIEDYGAVIGPKGQDYLGRIAKAGGRLDQLTKDLLDYTRFSREEIKLTAINLESVVDDVLLNLEASIFQKAATVRVERPLPSVMGQHAYLVQIIGNFVSNALKFIAPNCRPVIDIWAKIDAGRVRIFVRDNGIGIPVESRAKVFLLFERLHSQESFEGTGAGLAIARKAAQRMKGDIGILDESSGGSVFWLECHLPK